MKIEKLTAYCLSKPHAIKEYPFGPEPAIIKVASKLFALISSREISLKCDPLMTQSMMDQFQAVTPGNLLNENNWITIKIDGLIPEDELHWMIDHSYDLVLKSLTKAERNGIS